MGGIGGPTCSGKTTLAEGIAGRFVERHPVVWSLDAYYRDLSALPIEERSIQNFDSPDALEWPLIVQHAAALRHGHSVQVAVYDFTAHARLAGQRQVTPGELVIVEGLHALYHPELRALYDLSLFVGLSNEACLARRMIRDAAERGRTPESIRRQFEQTVRPMADAHVFPARVFADAVLEGDAPVAENVARAANLIAALFA